MKFLHTADLHLGALPDSGFLWAEERAAAIRTSLSRILALAEREDVDLILIAGDLFHRQPLRRELKEVNYLFSTLTRAKVVIIAGNHDHITDTSPYIDFNWAENVYFITTQNMSSVYLEGLNTEVHGFSYYKKEYREPLYDGLHAPSDGRIHILLAHGGDKNHVPLHLPSLVSSGFNYVALGHIHQPRIYKDTCIAICGSPEPLDKTDLGVHGCILGSVTDKDLSLNWNTISETQYRELDITVSSSTTANELRDIITGALSEHPHDIFRLNLTGIRDPELSIDIDSILELGRVVDVTDNTDPEYDLNALLKEHAGDMISYYIRQLNAPDATPVMKKALYYGLRALLAKE